MNALTSTNFQFAGQTNVYHGKVRDVYFVSKNAEHRTQNSL